jgi:type I restriction enzyme, S subunit
MFPQPSAPVDLNAYYLQEILRILDLHVPGIEVWAFGSRAKWTAKAYSDLDLALITKNPLSLEEEASLREALDESTLPIRVDFVDWSTISESFRKIVSHDKVVIRRVESVNADQVSWPVIPLEAALDALIDYRGKTPEKTTSGIPLITAKVIKAGRIEPPTEFISLENYDKWMTRGFPKAGDVVLTTEAPLGEVAQLNSARVALAQRVILLRGKSGTLDNTYLRYLLQTSDMQEQLASRATGTTVLGIKQSELRQISIRIPPLDMQRSAAGLLAHLDDRIALLRETNATLEAIAQALFKSWFVDFDPVYAKQQGIAPAGMDDATAALFPDGFEESALGLVPKGWQSTDLEKLTKRFGGSIQTGPFGSQLHASDYVETGIPVVMPKDIQNRRATTDSIARIRAVDADRLARHKLAKGDIVFSRRGDVERHALISERENGWLCGTGCLLVRPGEKWQSPTFLSMMLDAPQARTWLVQHAVGATMPNINTGILGSVPVVLPPPALLTAFEDVIAVTEEQRSRNASTAETIATLRDTLLPRLISGQLRLPEAEAQLAEAGA